MSECVVRMEMPKNCETCPLRVNNSPTNVPDWICGINQWPTFYCKKSQNHANEDKYLYDCPIVCQLPKGHGDLIDRNDFIKMWKKTKKKRFFISGLDVAWLAHVTVPEERSET